jgi:hypothetical protein
MQTLEAGRDSAFAPRRTEAPYQRPRRIQVDAKRNPPESSGSAEFGLQGERLKMRFSKPYEQSRYVIENNRSLLWKAVRLLKKLQL